MKAALQHFLVAIVTTMEFITLLEATVFGGVLQSTMHQTHGAVTFTTTTSLLIEAAAIKDLVVLCVALGINSVCCFKLLNR